MIAGTLLLTVSCKDDDEATVTGFALDQTEVGFLNHGGVIAVSYTHLDVYKRQAPRYSCGYGLCCFEY